MFYPGRDVALFLGLILIGPCSFVSAQAQEAARKSLGDKIKLAAEQLKGQFLAVSRKPIDDNALKNEFESAKSSGSAYAQAWASYDQNVRQFNAFLEQLPSCQPRQLSDAALSLGKRLGVSDSLEVARQYQEACGQPQVTPDPAAQQKKVGGILQMIHPAAKLDLVSQNQAYDNQARSGAGPGPQKVVSAESSPHTAQLLSDAYQFSQPRERAPIVGLVPTPGEGKPKAAPNAAFEYGKNLALAAAQALGLLPEPKPKLSYARSADGHELVETEEIPGDGTGKPTTVRRTYRDGVLAKVELPGATYTGRWSDDGGFAGTKAEGNMRSSGSWNKDNILSEGEVVVYDARGRPLRRTTVKPIRDKSGRVIAREAKVFQSGDKGETLAIEQRLAPGSDDWIIQKIHKGEKPKTTINPAYARGVDYSEFGFNEGLVKKWMGFHANSWIGDNKTPAAISVDASGHALVFSRGGQSPATIILTQQTKGGQTRLRDEWWSSSGGSQQLSQVSEYSPDLQQRRFYNHQEDLEGKAYFRSRSERLDGTSFKPQTADWSKPEGVKLEWTAWDAYKEDVAEGFLYKHAAAPLGQVVGAVGKIIVGGAGSALGQATGGAEHLFGAHETADMTLFHSRIEAIKSGTPASNLDTKAPELLGGLLEEIGNPKTRGAVLSDYRDRYVRHIAENRYSGLPNAMRKADSEVSRDLDALQDDPSFARFVFDRGGVQHGLDSAQASGSRFVRAAGVGTEVAIGLGGGAAGGTPLGWAATGVSAAGVRLLNSTRFASGAASVDNALALMNTPVSQIDTGFKRLNALMARTAVLDNKVAGIPLKNFLGMSEQPSLPRQAFGGGLGAGAQAAARTAGLRGGAHGVTTAIFGASIVNDFGQRVGDFVHDPSAESLGRVAESLGTQLGFAWAGAHEARKQQAAARAAAENPVARAEARKAEAPMKKGGLLRRILFDLSGEEAKAEAHAQAISRLAKGSDPEFRADLDPLEHLPIVARPVYFQKLLEAAKGFEARGKYLEAIDVLDQLRQLVSAGAQRNQLDSKVDPLVRERRLSSFQSSLDRWQSELAKRVSPAAYVAAKELTPAQVDAWVKSRPPGDVVGNFSKGSVEVQTGGECAVRAISNFKQLGFLFDQGVLKYDDLLAIAEREIGGNVRKEGLSDSQVRQVLKKLGFDLSDVHTPTRQEELVKALESGDLYAAVATGKEGHAHTIECALRDKNGQGQDQWHYIVRDSNYSNSLSRAWQELLGMNLKIGTISPSEDALALSKLSRASDPAERLRWAQRKLAEKALRELGSPPSLQPQSSRGAEPVASRKAEVKPAGAQDSLSARQENYVTSVDRKVAELNRDYGGVGYHGKSHQVGETSVVGNFDRETIPRPEGMSPERFQEALAQLRPEGHVAASIHDVAETVVIESPEKGGGKRYSLKYSDSTNPKRPYESSVAPKRLEKVDISALGEPIKVLKVHPDGTREIAYAKAPGTRSYLPATWRAMRDLGIEASPVAKYIALGTAFSPEEIAFRKQQEPRLRRQIAERYGDKAPDILAVADKMAERLGAVDFFNHYIRPNGLDYNQSLQDEFQDPYVKANTTFGFFGMEMGGKPSKVNTPEYVEYCAGLPRSSRRNLVSNLLDFKILAQRPEFQQMDMKDVARALEKNPQMRGLRQNVQRWADMPIADAYKEIAALDANTIREIGDDALSRSKPRPAAARPLIKANKSRSPPEKSVVEISPDIILSRDFRGQLSKLELMVPKELLEEPGPLAEARRHFQEDVKALKASRERLREQLMRDQPGLSEAEASKLVQDKAAEDPAAQRMVASARRLLESYNAALLPSERLNFSSTNDFSDSLNWNYRLHKSGSGKALPFRFGPTARAAAQAVRAALTAELPQMAKTEFEGIARTIGVLVMKDGIVYVAFSGAPENLRVMIGGAESALESRLNAGGGQRFRVLPADTPPPEGLKRLPGEQPYVDNRYCAEKKLLSVLRQQPGLRGQVAEWAMLWRGDPKMNTYGSGQFPDFMQPCPHCIHNADVMLGR